ncbi:MAG: NAD-dependent epimerase/dehydratase family protein [Archangium sp.]|nr:NAD-dependent epimerase/dehydratase family protein [Archangium sp.]
MRLLHRTTGVDLIFGVGLVGAWVAEGVRLLPGAQLVEDRSIPTRWDALSSSLEELRGLKGDRVRVFWCAGKAGFASDQAQCDLELRSFETVLRWAEQLELPVEFHLASSAGGLHEGQLLVGSPAEVITTRPYAALKLAQERALQTSSVKQQFIYRLSSVYGVPVPERRLGLISTLVINALRRKPTLITAEASTLRDFVSAQDAGRFMAQEEKAEGLHYLVSGHPLSIWSLQLAVERALRRPVSVVYSVKKDNVASTSFLPSMRPPRWEASSVESNLPRITAAAQSWASFAR